jgi:DNA-binding response OmpR family regulator
VVCAAKRYALLIEDEALIAAVASESLQELGFEVIEAGSAGTAMDCARKNIGRLEVAIVDIGLPDRRGDDLVADLRALRSDLPIVIATGYAPDSVSGGLATDQRTVMLAKPYDVTRLQVALNALNLM